jgi:SAM-dependent methyltransferase
MATPLERFTGHAAAYASGRPGYADDVLEALFAGGPSAAAVTAVDLGAGTGISARALAGFGARVFAVEPNAAMRAAAAPDSRVTWIDGTAESTGLPAAAADLVVAFQAWHWFDAPAAFAEARRIVRPGGRIAVVYYERDERDEATAAYGALVRAFAVDDTEARRARALAGFCALPGAALTELPSEQVLDAATFAARLASTSYLPKSGTAHATLLAAMDDYFNAHATSGLLRIQLTTSVARLSRA